MQPDWVDDWTAPESLSEEALAEAIPWLHSLPSNLHALMMRFPPSSIVRVIGDKKLVCPAPGGFGIISSYIEPSNQHPNGMLTVRRNPEDDIRFECDPDWLEVVGYYRGITPQFLARILGN